MSRSRIRTWQFQGVTLELRDNPIGRSVCLPRHSHQEYQIIIAEHMTMQYGYRGGKHIVAPGSLVILHPDEVHTARGRDDAQPLTPLRTLLVPPRCFEKVTEETRTKRVSTPFFPDPTLRNDSLFSRFLHLHEVLEKSPMTLERDVLLLTVLAELCVHCPAGCRIRPAGRERVGVRRVRRYLEDKYAENVQLTHLAEIAGLSPFYLCRVFSQEVGLPPQTYHAQVRVEHAKALLVQGHPIREVALLTGFADQSHFTRQFKKCVGVTPGRYIRQS